MKKQDDALVFLGKENRELIESCIADVEKNTSAELKIVVVTRCSPLAHIMQYAKRKAIYRRAVAEFAKLGIHNTRDNTGVLILVSRNEKMVQVLAGEAINEVVPEGAWPACVSSILEGIKSGNIAQGFCDAVHKIGDLMAKHFPPSADNPDEICNKILFKGSTP